MNIDITKAIPVIDAENITEAEFKRHYLKPQKPNNRVCFYIIKSKEHLLQ